MRSVERHPMARLARVLGCTEGQAYTLVIAVVLTVAAVWAGVPPTLVDRTQVVPAIAPRAPLAPAVEPVAEDRSPLAPVPFPDPASPIVITPPPSAPPAASAEPRVAQPSAATRLGNARIAATVGQPGAPDGIGVLADGGAVVSTNNGGTRGASGPSEVIRFSPEGVRERSVQIEGQSQARTSGLGGLVIDGAGNIFVSDTPGARVLRVDRTGRQNTYAELPDVGACALLASADVCEQGSMDDRPTPRGLALDSNGVLLVADAGQALIWRIGIDGKPALWESFPETDPPTAVAFEPTDSVLVVVSRSLEVSRAGVGLLHRFETRTDGSAGRSSVVMTSEAFAEPSAVAVGPAGEIVVALQRANAVVLLSADGKQRDQLEAADVEARTGVPLDGPSGVTVALGSAWVTNGSPGSNTEANWVVFEVPLR